MNIKKKYTFRYTILFYFITLFTVSFSSIIIYTYINNRKVVLDVAEDLINQVSNTIIEKTVNFLEPASKMTQMSGQLVKSKLIDIEDTKYIENYVIDTLNVYPQQTMFYIGYESGGFVASYRIDDGLIKTKIIDTSNSKKEVTFNYRDIYGNIAKTETDVNDSYDPRIRPWYIGAKETGNSYWSDVYIFSSSKKPGITSSFPIRSKDGQFLGVVGSDLEITSISEFLGTIDVGTNGIVYIINSKKQIIGYKDIDKIMIKENDKYRPVFVDEIEIPLIKESYKYFEENGSHKYTLKHEGENFIISMTDFPDTFGKDWMIGIAIPVKAFVGNIAKVNKIILIFSTLILGIGIFLISIFSKKISKPITELTNEIEQIMDFDFEPKYNANSKIVEVQKLSVSFNNMVINLKEAYFDLSKINKAFERFVPYEFLKFLKREKISEVELSDHLQLNMTILFSDIRNFTSISESKTPKEILDFLNNFFKATNSSIHHYGGFIDKFIGDAVMALFDHSEVTQDSSNAIFAAIKMQKDLSKYNASQNKIGEAPITVGIGIHTGPVVIGTVGSKDRMDTTVLGDSVNIASRLEGLTAYYGVGIIVSYQTLHSLKNIESFKYRELDWITVKGRSTSMQIYEIYDYLPKDICKLKRESGQYIQQGLHLRQSQKWDDAIIAFNKAIEIYPDDKVAQFHIEQCKLLQKNVHNLDWDGASVFQVK
ncbi:MAG: cache domain-containing protein [Spirochaetaceae bacterium]